MSYTRDKLSHLIVIIHLNSDKSDEATRPFQRQYLHYFKNKTDVEKAQAEDEINLFLEYSK